MNSCEIFHFNSMIDFAFNDSVVSKTILRKKEGTITMFAFDKGQGLLEHVVPYEAFLYIVEGELDVSIEDRKLKCEKGDFAILPPHIPHAVTALAPCKMFLIMIKS